MSLHRSKSKAARQVSSRITSLEIRSRSNALPVKSLIYAISHALNDPNIKREVSNNGISHRASTLSRHISRLCRISDALCRAGVVNPDAMYSTLRAATTSYVNFFYSMKQSTLNGFIEQFYLTDVCRRVRPENNLLVMPALMATKKDNRRKVSAHILNNLYRMPINFVYKNSKAAMHVELLEQSLSAKSISDSDLDRFSDSLKRLDLLVESIKNGNVNPTADEDVKEHFIDLIVNMSHGSDIGIADFINEKLSQNTTGIDSAKRIIRK